MARSEARQLGRWPSRALHRPLARPNCSRQRSVSHQTICLTDFFATCAAITGADLPTTAAEDSHNLLPLLLGETDAEPRAYTLHQTIDNSLAIRRGPWKLLDHKGSAGNNYDARRLKPYAMTDTDPEASGQLYHLGTDPGETRNLYSQEPAIVAELKQRLEQFKISGRSIPFQAQE